MLSPTPDQLALLQGFERTAFAIADTVNRRPGLKRASHAFLRTAGAAWVYHCTKHLLRTYQLDNLTALRPDRGVVLVSNHRSFFDMYTVSSVVLRHTTWVKGMYFPVRADYFYERPDGIIVNALMAGMTMYPPVMRSAAKRAFNHFSVGVLSDLLRSPGVLVGFHPEGTRNQTHDPYKLLPANPGIGQIIYHARPIVLPVFVLGLSNNLPRQVMGNFLGTSEPITMVFGRPMELESLYQAPAHPRTYKQIAVRARDELTALGQIERQIRAREGLPSLAPPPDPAPDIDNGTVARDSIASPDVIALQ